MQCSASGPPLYAARSLGNFKCIEKYVIPQRPITQFTKFKNLETSTDFHEYACSICLVIKMKNIEDIMWIKHDLQETFTELFNFIFSSFHQLDDNIILPYYYRTIKYFL